MQKETVLFCRKLQKGTKRDGSLLHIIDNSEYEVNRALNRYGNSKTYTVNVDIYQREATRERLVSVTSVEGR